MRIFVAVFLLVTGIHLSAQERAVQLQTTLSGHTKSILEITFSNDGKRIATSSNDGTIRLWNVATGESLATMMVDKNAEPLTLRWSPDDRRLAIAYYRQRRWEWQVWETPQTQAPSRSHRFQSAYVFEWSPDEPTTITFVANGQRILTASSRGPIQLWDAATGKLIHTYEANLAISAANYPAADVEVVSHDARFFTSGNWRIYAAATGQLLMSIDDGTSPISFSPDGKSFLTLRSDLESKFTHRQSYLSIRALDDGKELSTFQVPEGIWKVLWSPDGRTIAMMGLSFSPRVIDIVTGRENGRLPYGNCWPWQLFGSDGCERLKFSADGALLLKEKEPVRLWDAKTASLATVLKDAHLPAAFSPTDGQLLATRSADKKSVLLWRLKR
jgi:WD40 repeat protein